VTAGSGRPVRVVSVDGPMMPADYAQIASFVRQAQTGSVVVLVMNSPGGLSVGVTEAVESVESARERGVPVLGYTRTVAASAGYQVLAACDRIDAAASAVIGCIGSMIPHYDYSGMMEQQGVKVDAIVSAPLKAAGLMGKPMTAEERAALQELVNEQAAVFTDLVVRRRGLSAEQQAAAFTGAAFGAARAMGMGLIDGVIEPAAYAAAIEDQAL
jgi:signal peptide peptidase SppA